MHGADFREISSNEVLKIAKEKKQKEYPLVVITSFMDKDDKPVVCYSYDVDGAIQTYKCIGESALPSIVDIYGVAAQWFEEEINEFMGVEFKGHKIERRLFLPDEFDGSGQILVKPMSELRINKQ